MKSHKMLHIAHNQLPKIAISIGDLNGVGIEIALRAHNKIKKLCNPIYCINKSMLQQSAALLDIQVPNDFLIHSVNGKFKIKPGKITKKAGQYSFDLFLDAVNLAKEKKADAIVTLPIHKEAWSKAGIHYVGHTDALRDIFKKDAIMMLGCNKMFVALYTEHIPLKDVPKQIKTKKLTEFLIDFYSSVILGSSTDHS